MLCHEIPKERDCCKLMLCHEIPKERDRCDDRLLVMMMHKEYRVIHSCTPIFLFF